MSIIEKSYDLQSFKLEKDCHILLVSDFHFKEKYDFIKLQELLGIVIQSKPDFVCIPGDILDRADIEKKDYQAMIEYLKLIAYYAKTFVSIGNHDMMSYSEGKVAYFNKQWFHDIRHIPNVIVLNNQSYKEPSYNISLSGITMPVDHYEEFKEDEEDFLDLWDEIPRVTLPKNHYRIALIHSPNAFLNKFVLKETNFTKLYDLTLSGHMHGGLVPPCMEPIMKSRGIISPCKKPFPKYTRGHIEKDGMDSIITTGFNKLGCSFDSIFPPEVVHVKIKKLGF